MQKSECKNSVEVAPPTNKSVTASKKIYERLWQFIFLVISVISAFLFNKIYIYQTNQAFDSVRKGDYINLIIYGLPFAILYTIFDMAVHYFFDDLCFKYYINQKAYADIQARKKRSYTIVKWGYSAIYYSLSSLACFLVLKNTSYFPSWLGGAGSPNNIYNNFPQNSEFSFEIQVLYILQFGKHLSRMICHLFIRPEGNYYEFALHHTLSVFLIVFSYTMDQWLIGVFVMFIHDCTDLTLIFARGYKDYKSHSLFVLKILNVVGFLSWVIFRLFIFYSALISSFHHAIANVLSVKFTALDPIFKQTMQTPIYFMAGMLMVLQVMQIFWIYYIIRSVVARHNYD